MNLKHQKNFFKNEVNCMLVCATKKFSPDLFRNAVNNAFLNQQINGKDISSKQEIYDYLSEKMNKTSDTIRKWMANTSNGPGNPSEVKVLEEIFNTSLYETISVPYFADTREALIKIHTLIKSHLRSGFPEDEETFIEMCDAIDSLELRIPASLYEKIQEFINIHITPMVYNHREVFHEEYTEKYGEWDENGTFIIKEPCEDNFKRMHIIHLKIVMEVEKNFNEFTTKYIRPYTL